MSQYLLTDVAPKSSPTDFPTLTYQSSIPPPIPSAESLPPTDVLVRISYVSLNYRDLLIPKGKYGFPHSFPRIPCSDASATVLAVGSRVAGFRPGDRVLTLFNQTHQYGAISADDSSSGLGGALDGTLRQYATFPETGLVHCPSTLSLKEGATLTCAGLTAWNALYGLKPLKAGDVVLTQGTGGVSVFAAQIAKAAGATVIATTGSEDKERWVRETLGADFVLNYKSDPKWGETAKRLSTGGKGVDYVVEVGGPRSMAQSLLAVKPEGVIGVIGFLGGVGGRDPKNPEPSFLECLTRIATVRGVLVGSRQQFEDMCRAYESGGIGKPIVDQGKVWAFEDAKAAYEYMWARKHGGKVVIKVCGGDENDEVVTESKGAKL